jgi:hypothetical protein
MHDGAQALLMFGRREHPLGVQCLGDADQPRAARGAEFEDPVLS